MRMRRYAQLPNRADHDRTSLGTAFDISVRVGSGIGEDVWSSRILFTTRKTDRQGRGKNGKNSEAVNVCYIVDNEAGKVREKVNWIGSRDV